MATRVRKQVYIDAQQEVLLKRLAAELGLSEAEIVRQAIDRRASEVTVEVPDPEAWARERAFIEELMQRPVVAGGRTWTRDDLHDRASFR